MNIRLLAKLLGILAALIGGFMVFSLPWAISGIGRHEGYFERVGFTALSISIGVCLFVALILYQVGRTATGKLYRKEAMAAVGLSWILATLLGALPFYLSGTLRGPSIRLFESTETPLVLEPGARFFHEWETVKPVSPEQFTVLQSLLDASSQGLSIAQLHSATGLDNFDEVVQQLKDSAVWSDYLRLPGERTVTADRASNYRIRWARMTLWDSLFESQSGFSTTGASVLSQLEDPQAVPSCILFWRSSTHFLGGLGIIVLFVVLLGQGSAGKALMRTEVPGPATEGTAARIQHSAWTFAAIYVVLNVILTIILLLLGMNLFDALCHAFGTMATGGFSTCNASLGHFQSPAIEYVVIVFMILAGTNFTLLYLVVLKQPGRLLADLEWRTYILLIVLASALVILFGFWNGDPGFEEPEPSFRNGLFQVVSVMTTTGYGTNDFDSWNQFGRVLILILMFVGGCAGSTGGGMKVIRHVLIFKILWIEIEKSFHPRVIKPLRYQGRGETDEYELKHGLLVYVTLVLALFILGWLFVVGVEPNSTWGPHVENKLVDSASCVAATLNNIGPGLGIVGPTRNYGDFSGMSKLFFVWLMMLGRLEIWPVLVLFAPRFWRNR